MARSIRKKPITADMYRHFAAVTVACTLALAMFANGENREALAAEVAKSEPPKTENRPTKLVQKSSAHRGSFGNEDFDSGFGEPMDGSGASASGIIPGSNYATPNGMPAGYTAYGVTVAQWNAMTDEQKKRLIAKHEASRKAAQTEERASQIDSLLAASRERSGSAELAPD